MELWVRSQDKETLKIADTLDIYELDGKFYIEESGTDVGIYKTKERALEVLDEIQLKIEKCNMINFVEKKEFIKHPISYYVNVYEMPKE